MNLSSYKLTFQDEFGSLSLYANPNGGGTWKTWFYFGDRSLPSNGEMQYYMDPWFKGSSGSALGVNPFSTHADPTQAGDSVLRITAQPSSEQVKNSLWGYNYTSGLITTEPTFTQKYGYFEIRAKLPEGKGMWPAFWLLPADKTWPPEIDVLEAFGGDNGRGEGGAFEMHWAAHSTDKGGGGWVPTGVDTQKTYNTYAVDWQADYITYYFNGQQVGRIPTPADMHKPMYMMANVAVGGNWAGAPAPGTVGSMDIDYIRAYSKDPNAPVYSGNTGPTNPVPNPTPETPPPSTGPVLDDVMVPTLSGAVTNILANGATAGTTANDQLNANWGNTQVFRGGKGDDLYGVGSTSMTISENAGEGVDTVSAWVEYMLPAYVENIVVGANYGVKITGNDGANVLKGNVGNDTMTGRGGNDLFVMARGGAQDTITDFSIGADQVRLEGYGFADFAAVNAAMASAGGSVVLNLGGGDSLTFQGRSIGEFTGANFGMAPSAADGTGGTGTASPISVASLGNLPGWKLAASRDFNNDGSDDLVWRHTSNGQNVLWLMDEGKHVATKDLGTFTGWEIGGLGDFNADGTADILWSNTAGQNFIWLMDDGQPMKSYFGGNIPGWTLAASSDLNGDGATDLLWRNVASGENYLWLMNDGQPYSSYWLGTIPGWEIGGSGDVSGDGTDDLIWRNSSTGESYLWVMKNGGPGQSWSLGHRAGSQIVDLADFNADGTGDILWRNSAGQHSVSLMSDGQSMGERDFGALSGYRVNGVADVDGDGASEIIAGDAGWNQYMAEIRNPAALTSGDWMMG
jgi:beta-glucanase (GH16 family)